MSKISMFGKLHEGFYSGAPSGKEFKPGAKKHIDVDDTQKVAFDVDKTLPERPNPNVTKEVPAFKAPTKLGASKAADRFLKKIDPKTKIETPFDRANKKVDKIAAGVHKDTTSIVGRMKTAGVPQPKSDYKVPDKPDTVDKTSPEAHGAYQKARSGGDNGRFDATTNLDRPAIWRAQEKQAGGQGAHDYNVAKHSAEPVAPKAKVSPPTPETPKPAAPTEPGPGSSGMADHPAPATPEKTNGPAPVFAQGEHPLRRERQTTPRGKKVVGEPELTPPTAPPPTPKPPAAPPPSPKQKAAKPVAQPKPQSASSGQAAPKASIGKGMLAGAVNAAFKPGLIDKAVHIGKHLGGQAANFIKASTRVRKV